MKNTTTKVLQPIQRTRWMGLQTLALLSVWILVQGGAPLLMESLSTDAVHTWTRLVVVTAAASVWVLTWSVIHRHLKGESAGLAYIQAVALALVVEAIVIQFALPAFWFAMAWPWHEAYQGVAQCFLMGLVVRHHLTRVLPVHSRPGIQRIWAMSLVVCMFCVALWHLAQQWVSPARLPYVQNVQPSVLMLQRGVSTEEALDSLWPEVR